MLALALGGALVAWPLRVARADAPPSSAASDADARAAAKREFSAGDDAYARGEFQNAAAHFEAAYKLAPHPAALLNAAEAWEGAKSYARAATLYAKYLKDAPPDAAPRGATALALKRLAPKVAELDLSAPGLTDLAVDGKPAEASVIYVEPGHHFVYAKKDDRVARSDVDVAAGSVTEVTLTPPPDLPTPPPPIPTARGASPPVTGEAAVAPPSWATQPEAPKLEAARGTHVLPPWVVILGSAVTAVGVAGTIWSGIETEQFKSTVYDPSPSTSNLDAGLTRERRTNFLLGATVAAGVATGVFAIWFVDWRGPGGNRVGLGASPSQVALRFGF
jgi:hypothetical protein